MEKLFAVIQKVLYFSDSKLDVVVMLKNGDKKTGIITDFSGEDFIIDGVTVSVGDVDSIEEKEQIDLKSFMMKKITIELSDSTPQDVVMVSADEKAVSFISAKGQQTVETGNIKKIIFNGEVVFSSDKGEVKEEKSESYAETNEAEFFSEETRAESEDEKNINEEKSTDFDTQQEIPNPFEKGLIEGNLDVVDGFVFHSERLLKLGYSEKEVERIIKVYKNTNWKKNAPYDIANRLMSFQMNRNGLAEEYYETALKKLSPNDEKYKKSIGALHQFKQQGSIEAYIDFWKKNSKYLKDGQGYCNQYIDALLKLKGIIINPFEKAVVSGDMEKTSEILSDELKMSELGYNTEDLERIRKTIRSCTWDKTWYKIATRLSGMQMNRNGLAELYYESALMISDKKSDEYAKIINALASIKMNQDRTAYIKFFNIYRERLKTNRSFCIAYANSLLELNDWRKLEKELPMFKEQLVSAPALLEKLMKEVDYYKQLPVFKLENFPMIFERYHSEEDLYEQEKDLIEHLPEKEASYRLLDIYFDNQNEEAYFELIQLVLFFIVEEKESMIKLYTMLKSTEKTENIKYFMERLPVFWCDDLLIKKYYKALNISNPLEDDFDCANSRLKGHIISREEYCSPNAFENCIINKDIDGVRVFFENPDKLEELGYTESEIEDIVSTDAELQFSEDSYTMRRILAFQGNVNHLAEQFLFEAYYINKIDMCNRLFPLLIEEKRGDLILALFEFDRSLSEKLMTYQRFFCLALSLAEKNDDAFFAYMESRWIDYNDDIVLDRMLSIAEKEGKDLLVRQLRIQKEKPRGNEFEMALMRADASEIRAFVKDAGRLVQLGYTPEEIAKISKIFNLHGINNSTKPGQIANRVYSFQKNKNNLAENLLLRAIADDNSEDRSTVCKNLFQLYVSQRNYKMVCSIYEDYLSGEIEEKFNSSFAYSYCVALFELGRYRDFLNFYERNRDRWSDHLIYLYLPYVCEALGVHDYDDIIWEKIRPVPAKADIVMKYIKLLLEKDISALFSERVVKLINLTFAGFTDGDIDYIVQKVKESSDDEIPLPQGGLLLALKTQENRSENINLWIDHVAELVDNNNMITLLIRLKNIFPDESKEIIYKAVFMYSRVCDQKVADVKIDELMDFITANLGTLEEKNIWCEKLEDMLRSGKGGMRSLKGYLDICQSPDVNGRFWGVYADYKKKTASELVTEELFSVLWNYYDDNHDEFDEIRRREIAQELIRISGDVLINSDNRKNLSLICGECGMEFEAGLYLLSADRELSEETDGTDDQIIDTDDQLPYYKFVIEKLDSEERTGCENLFKSLSRYVYMSREDGYTIDRMKNNIRGSELWIKEELDILAKGIICNPDNYSYWRLLKSWVEKNENNNEKILTGILYQLSSQSFSEMEKALSYAIDNGLRNLSFDLVMKLMDNRLPSSEDGQKCEQGDNNTNIVAAQKNLRSMIRKGWFSEDCYKDDISGLFDKIKDKISLSEEEDYIWNSVRTATDLVIATGEYRKYFETFKDYLSKSCSNQCCVVIADMMIKDKLDLAETAFSILNSNPLEIPYKKLVSDMFETRKAGELNEAEKEVLKLSMKDYGNSLGVDELLGFYCDMYMQGLRKTGLDSIKILIRYMDYDPVLYETAGSFLRDSRNLDENEDYYNYMYDYLKLVSDGRIVKFFVGSMVCGEYYFRQNGRRVRSFTGLINERFADCLEKTKKYQEFCDSIIISLKSTDNFDFVTILFRAIFSGDWVSVLEYDPSDSSMADKILKENIRTERLNVIRDCYRSLIKGIILFLIRHADDIGGYQLDLDRARRLWNCIYSNNENSDNNNINNIDNNETNTEYAAVGCTFDFIKNSVCLLDKDSLKDLERLWGLDIETMTIFKNMFGKYVLSLPTCCNYSRIFTVFVNAYKGEIFDTPIFEFLKSIDRKTAVKICESYEVLYIKPSIIANPKGTGKPGVIDSDYERGVFSKYLRSVTGDYFSIEKSYERYRKKYELVLQLYDITDGDDVNTMSFKPGEKRRILSIRALYYYYSVLAGKPDVSIVKKMNSADVINSVMMALSKKSYASHLEEFISYFNEDGRIILGVMLLIIQGRQDEAARYVSGIASGELKDYLCFRISLSYGKKGYNKEGYQICQSILADKNIRAFWIQNNTCDPSMEKEDPYKYLSRPDEKQEKTTEHPVIIENNKSKTEKNDNKEENVPIGILNVDHDATEIPEFVKKCIDGEYDEYIEKEKERLILEKNSLGKGFTSWDAFTDEAIKTGIRLLQSMKTKVDETIMLDIFRILRPYSEIDSYQISALHGIFQKYILGFSDISSLVLSVYENREAIKHLCYEQDKKNTRLCEDIKAVTVLINILLEIASDLNDMLKEEDLKEKLIENKRKLYEGTAGYYRFRKTADSVCKMIQNKIDDLNSVPRLVVYHLNKIDKDEKYNWKEIWVNDTETGFVRGVVENKGGNAYRAEMSVRINSELRETFTIDKIARGRKIPFSVSYNKNDVIDGKVNWAVEDLKYYGESNDVIYTSKPYYGVITVEFSDSEWKLSPEWRDIFNTEIPADGENGSSGIELFFGRKMELGRLEDIYSISRNTDYYPSLLITGLRRIGKSSVIKNFRSRLMKRDNLAPVYVDAQRNNGDISNPFFEQIFIELRKNYLSQIEKQKYDEFRNKWESIVKNGDWIAQLPNYFMELSELLDGRKVIVFLDEMENVFYSDQFSSDKNGEQFFGMFRFIIQNYQKYVSFIFCGSDKILTSCLEEKRESQMFQNLYRIFIGRMSINDIRDMFDEYNRIYDIRFGEDAIEAIMFYANGLIWYTKLIAEKILDGIIYREHMIRDEIHRADVDEIVEELINGGMGTALIDLLDNNFGSKRRAIIRSMAGVINNPNESVNTEIVLAKLREKSYVDSDTGEVVGSISEEELIKNLNILEKMDFIEKDPEHEMAYRFSTELYRLIMSEDGRIDKFVRKRG